MYKYSHWAAPHESHNFIFFTASLDLREPLEFYSIFVLGGGSSIDRAAAVNCCETT